MSEGHLFINKQVSACTESVSWEHEHPSKLEEFKDLEGPRLGEASQSEGGLLRRSLRHT